MAKVFQDIELEWGGRKYVIPSNKVMQVIARIEDVVTLAELHKFGAKEAAPLAKIAMAFGSVLRFAGANVEDQDVYAGLFTGDTREDQKRVIGSITTLLAMMLPPEAMQKYLVNVKGKDGATSGNASPAVAVTSKRRTRRRSAVGE
jgi:hypothetical protein